MAVCTSARVGRQTISSSSTWTLLRMDRVLVAATGSTLSTTCGPQFKTCFHSTGPCSYARLNKELANWAKAYRRERPAEQSQSQLASLTSLSLAATRARLANML